MRFLGKYVEVRSIVVEMDITRYAAVQALIRAAVCTWQCSMANVHRVLLMMATLTRSAEKKTKISYFSRVFFLQCDYSDGMIKTRHSKDTNRASQHITSR
jgi:hypothetical protein